MWISLRPKQHYPPVIIVLFPLHIMSQKWLLKYYLSFRKVSEKDDKLEIMEENLSQMRKEQEFLKAKVGKIFQKQNMMKDYNFLFFFTVFLY